MVQRTSKAHGLSALSVKTTAIAIGEFPSVRLVDNQDFLNDLLNMCGHVSDSQKSQAVALRLDLAGEKTMHTVANNYTATIRPQPVRLQVSV